MGRVPAWRRRSPPRLLIVVTGSEVGGAQTFVSALAEGVCERYEVRVAANDPDGPLAARCRVAGIDFEAVPALERDIDPRADVAAVRALRGLYDRFEPDLVHLNSSKAAAVGRLAAVGLRVPVVYTAHGWPFGVPGRSRYLYWAAELVLAPLAAAVVCVSEWDRRLARIHRVARERQLHVIHNGIAVQPTPPLRGAWPRRPSLACVARLKEPKDVPLLLEAMARPGVEHWRVDVFGDGSRRREAERMISALGLTGRVRLLGDRPDVVAALDGYDAFALPSKSEGFPYSTLEAMSRALPVVASRVGGVPEQIDEGRTGYLVPRGDAGAFAQALRRLDADGPAARAMGLAGYEVVRARFGQERMVARYVGLYGSLLGSP
jgi:glycosyltransferase involved in cell wall biosynthesis